MKDDRRGHLDLFVRCVPRLQGFCLVVAMVKPSMGQLPAVRPRCNHEVSGRCVATTMEGAKAEDPREPLERFSVLPLCYRGVWLTGWFCES